MSSDNPTIPQLRSHIRNLTPFQCDDLDALCSAIIEEYDYDAWGTDIVWAVGSVRHAEQHKNHIGSWNFPVRFVRSYGEERILYKVFRQKYNYNQKDKTLSVGYMYEFHKAWVPTNQWVQAEISGSEGLCGLKAKSEGGTGGRFHLLWNEQQAIAYRESRLEKTDEWFPKHEAVIKKVKARNFQTIDLVYVPPKQWVWGIDASEIYVEL